MSNAVYKTDKWCRRGHFNPDQADKYAELCEKVQPRYALETGFCTGRSAACVLQYAEPWLRLMISVDKTLDRKGGRGRAMALRLEAKYPIFRVIESPSKEVLTPEFFREHFPNGIDFATVDGDHTYDGCMFDLASIAPNLTKHGIIVVDDYRSSPPNGVRIPSVTESVDDFLAQNVGRFNGEPWNREGKGFCIIRKVG